MVRNVAQAGLNSSRGLALERRTLGGKSVQKLVYLRNSRDYAEEGDINQNKYFTHINELLDQGWKVAHVTHDVVEIDDNQHPSHKETFVAFVLLEKPKDY